MARATEAPRRWLARWLDGRSRFGGYRRAGSWAGRAQGVDSGRIADLERRVAELEATIVGIAEARPPRGAPHRRDAA